MPFQPLTDYTGYNHVPEAGSVWYHLGNGNAYCCAVEKDPQKKQDLSVYRMRHGAPSWELVKRYEGGQASTQQVTFGGAAIAPNGDMLVVTSLIIPGAPIITTEKFQGCWIVEPGKDDPWVLQSDLVARIASLEAQLAGLPPTVTGAVVYIPARSPQAGGRLQLSDGKGGWWFFDVWNDSLRVVRQEKDKAGVEKDAWT